MLAIKCCVNSPPGPVAGGIPGRVKKTKKKQQITLRYSLYSPLSFTFLTLKFTLNFILKTESKLVSDRGSS